jgi:hypothetical protein
LFGETEAAAADVVANKQYILQQQHQPTLRSFFLPIFNHQNSLQREELVNSNIAKMQMLNKLPESSKSHLKLFYTNNGY